MTERKAWHCPSCNRYHAPHVETCPGSKTHPAFQFRPFHPKPGELPAYDPCADCKGACGNAACPKRAVVTSVSGAEATGIGRPQ